MGVESPANYARMTQDRLRSSEREGVLEVYSYAVVERIGVPITHTDLAPYAVALVDEIVGGKKTRKTLRVTGLDPLIPLNDQIEIGKKGKVVPRILKKNHDDEQGIIVYGPALQLTE